MVRGTSFEALPWELLSRIADCLPSNDVACTLRLLNKAAADLFARWKVVRLSQIVPHFAFVLRWGRPDAMRGLTLQQRRQLLALTARSGSLKNLQFAYAEVGCLLVQEVFDAAVAGGSRVVCQWLFDMRCPIGEETSAAAAQARDLELVRFLLQLQPQGPLDRFHLVKGAWTGAARGGHRTICEALRADGLLCPRSAVFAAARGGHVGLTEWLLQLPELQKLSDIDKERLLTGAALGFDLPSLQRLCYAQLGDGDGCMTWLRGHGFGPRKAALASPTPDWRAKFQWLHALGARGGSTNADTFAELAQRSDWLERVEQGRSPPFRPEWQGLIEAAMRASNRAMLRFLVEQRMAVVSQSCAIIAAASGDVSLLAELLALGRPNAKGVAFAAASRGHLHVLQWLAGPEAGPVGEKALQLAGPGLIASAAESGSVEMVQWLRARGCPLSGLVFRAAVGSGNVAFLEWLVAEGCPTKGSAAYLEAASKGDLATLGCLLRLGRGWGARGEVFNRALECYCRPEVLRWLHAQGFPVDWRRARDQVLAKTSTHGSAYDAELLTWIESHIPQS